MKCDFYQGVIYMRICIVCDKEVSECEVVKVDGSVICWECKEELNR